MDLTEEEQKRAKKKKQQHDAWLRWYLSPKGLAYKQKRKELKSVK